MTAAMIGLATWLPTLLAVVLVATPSGASAHAPTPATAAGSATDCESYRRAWNKIRRWNTAEAKKLARELPEECHVIPHEFHVGSTPVRRSAGRTIASGTFAVEHRLRLAAEARADEQERAAASAADDAVWRFAASLDTATAYDLYRVQRPGGLHVAQAGEGYERTRPFGITLCNKSGSSLSVAMIVTPPDLPKEVVSGWTKLPDGACTKVNSKTEKFALFATDRSNRNWAPAGKVDQINTCTFEPDFTRWLSDTCPASGKMRSFTVYNAGSKDWLVTFGAPSGPG
jgi:hypothetical protein